MNSKIGILMLDTKFRRPVGDIGNEKTFSFSVTYKTVKGASVSKVVNKAESTVLELFIESAKALEQKGTNVITTSCGFLAIHQKEIQKQLKVPFFASSLVQIPLVSIIAGGPIGVITASKSHLTEAHLKGVNADRYPLIIEGMDEMPAFYGAIVEENIELNEQVIYEEMRLVTRRLLEKNPRIKAIVLECTNMPPYKSAIREVTDVPIFDIITLTNYIYETTESISSLPKSTTGGSSVEINPYDEID